MPRKAGIVNFFLFFFSSYIIIVSFKNRNVTSFTFKNRRGGNVSVHRPVPRLAGVSTRCRGPEGPCLPPPPSVLGVQRVNTSPAPAQRSCDYLPGKSIPNQSPDTKPRIKGMGVGCRQCGFPLLVNRKMRESKMSFSKK